MMDLKRFAPVERQHIGEEIRFVRLSDEPMHANDVLTWLEDNGFVKRTRTADHMEDKLHGWGTTYFALPFDRSVAR